MFRFRTSFALALLLLPLNSGCDVGPSNGRPITGCPDGVVERLVVSASGVIEKSSSKFLAEVQRDDDVLVVVDFWASWCGPCQMLAPSLESIAKEWGDRVRVVKVDVDDKANIGTIRFLDVSSIPDVRIYRRGVQVDSFIGPMPKAEIHSMLKSLQ